MSSQDFVRSLSSPGGFSSTSPLTRIHLDPLLLVVLVAIVGYGLIVLYSALDQNRAVFANQVLRLGLAFVVLLVAAQLQPGFYLRWSPFVYVAGVVLLVLVLLVGVSVKGSQRWLEIPGLLRFQPSELRKICRYSCHFNVLSAGRAIASNTLCLRSARLNRSTSSSSAKPCSATNSCMYSWTSSLME